MSLCEFPSQCTLGFLDSTDVVLPQSLSPAFLAPQPRMVYAVAVVCFVDRENKTTDKWKENNLSELISDIYDFFIPR